MTATSLMLDVAWAGLLIAIGQFIRTKVKFLQKCFVPSALIAGFLGLILGKQVLNVIPFSDSIGSYSGVLIMLVFACIGVSGFSINKKNLKNEVGRVYGMGAMMLGGVCWQVVLGCTFSILVISLLFPQINKGFGFLLMAGFAGGHGTAAAIGKTFAEQGFADATDLGMTSATVGILAGILVGLALIKWATKKGYTQYLEDSSKIPADMLTGLVPEEQRQSMGKQTIAPVTLDSLAWHLGWALIATGAGYYLCQGIKKVSSLSIPDFLCTFLCGFLMFVIFSRGKKRGVYRYIDTKVFSRISGTATDLLVFFGVASIKISVVATYAVPLIMLFVFGIITNVLCWFFFARGYFKESWFERGMLHLGMSFGVSATGMILLRIVDPDGKSRALNDFALQNPFMNPIQSLIYGFGPIMLMTGKHWQIIGICLGILVVMNVIARIFGWWHYKVPLNERGAMPEDAFEQA